MASMIIKFCHSTQKGCDPISAGVRGEFFESMIDWFQQTGEILGPNAKLLIPSRDEVGPREFMVSDDGEINFNAVIDPSNQCVLLKFHEVPVKIIMFGCQWMIDHGWREHWDACHETCGLTETIYFEEN